MKDGKTVVSGELEWMGEDFEINGVKYFTLIEAKTNCPEGWRLPTIDEFYDLELKNKLHVLNDSGVLIEGEKDFKSYPVYLVEVELNPDVSGQFAFYVHNNRLYSVIFSEDVKIPVRYVRDHKKVTYVVLFGLLDCDDNYVTHIEYAGNDQEKAYSYTKHPDFDSLSVWQDGKKIRDIYGYMDEFFFLQSR